MVNLRKIFAESIVSMIVIAGLISSLFLIKLFPEAKNNNENTNTQPPLNLNLSNINPTQSEFDKFSKLVKEGKYILVNNREIVSPEFSATDERKNNEIALEFLNKNSFQIKVNKEIVNGYLYIEAGTNIPTVPLAEKESIYYYLQNGNFGGHLFKPDSLVSSLSENGISQYLFKLDNIPLTTTPYSDKNSSRKSDWTSVLKNPGIYSLGGFVSTTKFGKITKVIIAFEGEKNSIEIPR